MLAIPKPLDRPFVLLTLTALFWGGNAVAGRFADGFVSPMWLTFGRWSIAVVIVGWLGREAIRRDLPVMRERWRYLALMGATGFTLFNFMLYTALHYTSAINVAIEQSAMPLFIFALSYALFRTRVRLVQLAGFLLTAAGVWVTATYGDIAAPFRGEGPLSGFGGLNRGDLIMIFAAFAYAAYTAFLPKKPAMDPLSFLFAIMLAAWVVALAGLGFETSMGWSLPPQGAQGWLVVLYAGIFPSILAQAFYIRGVEGIGANAAGLFINLVPVFAALLSVLVLGEALEVFHAVAFALVVGGVWLAGRGKARSSTV